MPENSAYVTDACERLLEALLSDRGLKSLVEVAADVLGNPVLVADPTYRYAARAGFELEEDDESTFAQVTRRELAEDDTILDEGVRYIIETGVDEELARSRGAVLRHNPVYGLDTLTQAVMVHGVCLGRVMAIARNRAFTEEDGLIFARLSALLGQELQKGAFLSGGDAAAGPYFLSRLLDDEQPNPISCARRMELVGFRPLGSLFVVCAHGIGAPLDARAAHSVKAQLAPLLVHSLATFYDDELVAVVSRRDAIRLSEADEAILVRVAAANNLRFGVSNAFSEMTDVRAHLNQARAAMRLGSTYTKVLEDTHVYRYCEYTYMEMLDICNDHVNLINYCHPMIWALWEHDQAHDSELVETLFAYMQNGCNTARTAALLSLHKNTLLYRLGRIKEITGNDLASGEDLFLFHLSIRTLIYLGILEPRTKPRTSADLHCPK